MRKAIATDPTDSARMVGRNFLGRGGDPYVPHFFLGEALFNQDRCAEALVEWEISGQAGVAGRREELLKIMQDGTAQCEARGVLPGPKLGPAVQAAADAVRTAATSAEDVRAWADAHPEFWNANADLRTRSQSAANDLAQARGYVSTGTTNRRQQDLENARRLAAGAEKLFRSVRGEAERRVKEAAGVSAGFDQALQAAYARASELDAAIKQAASVSRTGDPAISEDHRRAVQILREVQEQTGAAGAERPLADALRRVREADGVLTGARAKLDELVRAAGARELQALGEGGPAQFAAAQASLDTLTQALRDKPPAADLRAKIQPELDRAQRDLTRAPARLADAVAKADLTDARSAFAVAASVQRRLGRVAELLGPLDGALASFAVPDALRTGAQLFFDARYQDALGALTDELAASSEPSHRVHVLTLRSAALFALYEYGGRKDDALIGRARNDARAARALDPRFAPNPAAFSPRFIVFFLGATG
jgi:hypothetical protein